MRQVAALLGPSTGGLQASRVLKGEAWSASQPGSDWLLLLLPPGTCPFQAAPQALPSARRPPDAALYKDPPQTLPITWNHLGAHPAQGAPHVGLWQHALICQGPQTPVESPLCPKGLGTVSPGCLPSRCSLMPPDALSSFLSGHCGSLSLHPLSPIIPCLPALTAPLLLCPQPACGLSSKLPKSRVWSSFSPFLLARTWCFQVLGIGSCCSKNSGRYRGPFLHPTTPRRGARMLVGGPHVHPKGWCGAVNPHQGAALWGARWQRERRGLRGCLTASGQRWGQERNQPSPRTCWAAPEAGAGWC